MPVEDNDSTEALWRLTRYACQTESSRRSAPRRSAARTSRGDLFSVALAEAFDELPDPADVVEAVYVGNQSESYEHQIMYGTLLAEWAGLRHVPAERVEGCAAAAGLLRLRQSRRRRRTAVPRGPDVLVYGGSHAAGVRGGPTPHVAVVTYADCGRLLGRLAVYYADVSMGDPVELTVREPTSAVREIALGYVTDWPVHVFEPR